MRSNTGHGYNATGFLAHCDFEESQKAQEKFYREEIAPRLDAWENFTDRGLKALARAADRMDDVRLLVNETIDVKRDA
jgi:hypothetical protein